MNPTYPPDCGVEFGTWNGLIELNAFFDPLTTASLGGSLTTLVTDVLVVSNPYVINDDGEGDCDALDNRNI